MNNAFVHVELSTGDLAKAKTFYKKIFNWKLEDMKMGPGQTYTMVKPESGTGGGMQRGMPNAPTAWLPYVEVDDVGKTTALAKKAGAKIVVPPMDIGMGSLAVFTDPTGAALGIWQTKAAAPLKSAKKKVTLKSATKKKAAKKRRA